MASLTLAATGRLDGRPEAETEPRYATRFCGGLLLGGAALTAVVVFGLGMAGDHNPLGHYLSVLLCAGIAAVGGIACLAARGPAPACVLCLVPSIVVVLLTVPMVVTGATTPTGALLLTWPILFAGYLLPKPVAVATLVVVLAAFAFVAATGSVDEPLRSWLELAASANVTLVVVLKLRRRAEQLRDALTYQARTDPLTGLANRRAFAEAMDREYARHLRTSQPLSLISIDIDHFKRINDNRGHAVGDTTLRELGALLARQVRGFDTVGRLGGEEFGILITGCTMQEARARAHAVADTVRTESTDWEVPITVSVGVATIPHHVVDPANLLIAADRAMYLAKESGRDTVETAACECAGGCPH